MPELDVRYIDGRRRVSSARVHAADPSAVASVLGIAPASILSVEAVEARPPPAAGARTRFPLRLFSHELAVLLRAGIPLLEALVTLREKEESAGAATAIDAVVERLRHGEAFAQALAARPAEFDALFVAVVASAQRTGQLEQALGEHARYLAWVDDLRARLVAAAVYPLMLVTVSLAVIVFLLVFVVPRFAGLLDGVGGDIAPASRVLIDVGRTAGEHPWATIGIALALCAAPWLAWRSPRLRHAAVAACWRAPMLGRRLRVLALARLYRSVGMLLRAGVPLPNALRTADSVVAPPLRAPLAATIEAVSRGERLSAALGRADLATPVAARMVRVGERSGRVGDMLEEAAAFHDEEIARLSELVSRLVNPLLMLLMGGVIGTVVVLLYLPIFQLVEQVQ